MKRFFFILLIIICLPILLYGQEQIEYKINGVIDKTLMYDGAKVFLRQIWIDSTKTENIDSAVIKNGKFKMKGTCNKLPYLYFISVAKTVGNFIVLEPGIIKVLVDTSKIDITGTPINDDLHNHISTPWQKLQRELKGQNDMLSKMKALDKYKMSALKFVEKYAKYPVVEFFIIQLTDLRIQLPHVIESLPEESKARLERRKK